MSATEYWKDRYTSADGVFHHAEQNQQIAESLLRHVARLHPIQEALASDEIIEIGCGTGELAALIKEQYGTRLYCATDFSRAAVKQAQYLHPEVNFWVFDILKDTPHRRFDLLIASNVLEHFKAPHAVINNMFHFADKLLLVVPFNQPVTDGYDEEGGAGHVYQFTEAEFHPYRVHVATRFRSKGWTHSSCGEEPWQLLLLISQ